MNPFDCQETAIRIWSPLIIGLSILCLGSQIASAEGDTTPAMTLNLSIFSNEAWKATNTKPLHLFLSVYNDTARQQGEINRNNKKTLAAYKVDGSLNSMDEKTRAILLKNLAAIPIKSITIGSKDLPFKQWFNWQIVDSNGKKSPLKAEILAIDKGKENVVTFDENECMFVNFGVSKEQLKSLAPGNYTISVELSQAVLKNDPKTKSNEVTLNLVANDASSREKNYLYGLFYCLDENFEQAESFASKILNDDPNSLDGTGLMARVYTGRKQWKESLPLLQKYIKLHRKKFGGSAIYHPPRYYQLLLEIAKNKLRG